MQLSKSLTVALLVICAFAVVAMMLSVTPAVRPRATRAVAASPSRPRPVVISDDSEASSGPVGDGSVATVAPRRKRHTASPPARPASSSFDIEQLIDELPPLRSALPVVPIIMRSDSSQAGAPISQTVVERVVQNGMQPKYLVRNIAVRGNQFFTVGGGAGESSQLPPTIYIPDGQLEPMRQNHKYTGHRVRPLPPGARCDCRVSRPTVFLYRMSGHSTYHLWENNLGPFFQTLFDFEKDFASGDSKSPAGAMNDLLDPTKLLVVFTDNKLRGGPKAPHLLDRLLRTFSDLPLINASRIGEALMIREAQPRRTTDDANGGDAGDGRGGGDVASVPRSQKQQCTFVCFDRAILGVSAHSYRMRPLVELMKRNILTGLDASEAHNHNSKAPSTNSAAGVATAVGHNDDNGGGSTTKKSKSGSPRCVYISRNHPSIIRGRKIANERAFVESLNRTLIANGVAAGVTTVFMEQHSYAEQVRLATAIDIMFSPHGGGVANCIWMAQRSVMVEFVAPVGKTLPNMYHSMCSRSGIRHFSFLAEPDPADATNTDAVYLSNKRLFSNMVVPPDMIARNAVKALEMWRSGQQQAAAK